MDDFRQFYVKYLVLQLISKKFKYPGTRKTRGPLFQPWPSWTILLTWCTCYTPLCFDVWLRCCQQFLYRSAVLLYTTTMYNWTMPFTWYSFCNAQLSSDQTKSKNVKLYSCALLFCTTAHYVAPAWPRFCQLGCTNVSGSNLRFSQSHPLRPNHTDIIRGQLSCLK